RHQRPDRRAVPAPPVLRSVRGDRLDHGLLPGVRGGYRSGRARPPRRRRRGLRSGRLSGRDRAPCGRGPAGQDRPAARPKEQVIGHATPRYREALTSPAVHPYASEEFSADEAAVLRPYFTNLDQPVFAVVNLPEVVKGALFARYSRSPKSLRRLFLDE